MTYTQLPPVGDFGVLLTNNLLKTLVEDINYFRTPPQHIYSRDPGAANYTISSTSFGDIDATNMKPQLTFTGNPVLVELWVGRVQITTGPLLVTVTVDGSDIGGTGASGLAYMATSNNPLSFRWVITGLQSGLHTVAVQGRVGAGSATLTAVNGIQYRVMEL